LTEAKTTKLPACDLVALTVRDGSYLIVSLGDALEAAE
jgi:hypothetical protein